MTLSIREVRRFRQAQNRNRKHGHSPIAVRHLIDISGEKITHDAAVLYAFAQNWLGFRMGRHSQDSDEFIANHWKDEAIRELLDKPDLLYRPVMLVGNVIRALAIAQDTTSKDIWHSMRRDRYFDTDAQIVRIIMRIVYATDTE